MKKCITLGLFLTLLISCSGWEGKKSVVDGITYIENTGDGLWKYENNKGLRFEKLMELGKDKGDENYRFSSIASMTIDEDQNIYIYDAVKKEADIIRQAKKLRKELGITQPQIAKKSGMTQQMISRMEKLGNSPSLVNFIRYLDGAGLEMKIEKRLNGKEYYSADEVSLMMKQVVREVLDEKHKYDV